MDPYTRDVIEHGLSRRSFFSTTAAGAAGLGALGLADPAAAGPRAGELGISSDGNATLGFLKRPQPVAEADIKETVRADVVVVGAGAAGVPAALSAAENGASVVVVQKHPIVVSQGNTGSGLDMTRTDRAGAEALVSLLLKENAHRASPALLRQWAYHSGEAVRWVIDRAKRGGAQVVDQGTQAQLTRKVNGYELHYVTSFFGPKPYTTGDGMRALAKVAEAAGVKFSFRMPAQQLVQGSDGRVQGVLARDDRDGRFVRFLANKGVILATGDYQNNRAMCDYFVPDVKHFVRKQMDRTGDGHAMGYWAGGVIEPIGHTKVLHDFDAGPAPMGDMPFLVVNRDGRRFVNEEVEMALVANYLRSAHDAGHYCQVFDSDYMTAAAKWPGVLFPPERLKSYMPEEPGPKAGVFPSQTSTWKADTLEELARKLEVNPANFVATVQRYNELCTLGRDLDFGKRADHLIPVARPPFYGIHRRLRVTAIVSGILVNADSAVLDAQGQGIPGLFAVGNLSGGFYGGADYPLTVFGLSLGRCYTFGYLAGRHVARL